MNLVLCLMIFDNNKHANVSLLPVQLLENYTIVSLQDQGSRAVPTK